MSPWLIFIAGLFVGAHAGWLLTSLSAYRRAYPPTDLPPEPDPAQLDVLEDWCADNLAAWAEDRGER